MAENTATVVQQSAEHRTVFAPLDSTTFPSQLFWLVITFGLLYLLVRRVMLPRVGSVIGERSDRIKGDLALAEELRHDTQLALGRYNQALADARAKASDIVKDRRQRLELDLAKERARIGAEMAARISEAENQIAAAKARALTSVSEIATEAAGAIVSKLMDTEVTSEEVKSALIQHAAE